MLKTLCLTGLFFVAFYGCRGDDSSTGADAGPIDDGDTIQEVQSDTMPEGTPVTLRSVVVVAVDTYGGRTGGAYIMEPEGGPFSGVFIFLTDTSAAGLSPGDLVDVEGGVKDEFALNAEGRCLHCGARCPGVFEAVPGHWGARRLPVRLADYAPVP